MKRVITGKNFVWGIIGVSLVMVLASIETGQWHLCVLNTFSMVVYSMPFLLTFVFSTLSYGGGFCEDLECKFIYTQVIRGNLKDYVTAKAMAVFLGAVITMVMGILLYVFILRFYMPWVNLEEGTYETLITSGGLRAILKRNWFLLYYILFAFQYGMAAGILSVFASYLSLFYSNRLFVLSIPLAVWYCFQYLVDYFGGISFLKPYTVFNANNNVWNNDLLSLFYAIALGITLSSLITISIYRRLKRVVYGITNI